MEIPLHSGLSEHRGNKVTDSTEPFVTLFLAASRKLERLLVQLHPVLTVDQSYVLSEIALAQEYSAPITAQEISLRLRIEKSTLSRLLGRLADAHMVSFIPNPLDRRERFLGISEVGRKFLGRDLAARDRQIAGFSAALDRDESERLTHLLRNMADSLGEPTLPLSDGESSLKPEIRRLTRALGFLGGTIFGSAVPLEEAQMLSLLANSPEGLPRLALTESLPYDQTRISRLLSKFEEEGLLMRSIHPEDRRQFIITITALGQTHLKQVIESARDLFERGLQSLSKDEKLELLELLKRATADPKLSTEDAQDVFDGVALLRSDEERAKARTFVIHYLSRHGLLHECGETIIGKESKTYAAKDSGNFSVVIEAAQNRDLWQIKHFAAAADEAPIFDVFVALCRDIFVLEGASRLDIASSALRSKFAVTAPTFVVDALNWEQAAMRLESRRLDA
jgi:DNA-binding MarR family transcriptional regulator